MALRLVTPSTSAQTTNPTQKLAAARSEMSRAVVEAAQLLSQKDFDGWRERFATTAKIEDDNERYLVRTALIEGVLGAQGLKPHQVAQMFLAAATALVGALDDEPREPKFLNFAGVLLYELGGTKAAEAMFRAAQRLDPALPDVAGNIRACKMRKKSGSGPLASLPPAVLRELRGLGPHAERVAKRAQPATGQTLSLCMIVKDEEEMLPKCLGAVADFVDELIVVDTGSTDKTVEIAESFGAKVLHHKWTGDFSEARNIGFDAATSDWKMFLDADEVLVEGEGPKLRELLGHTWREAIYLVETNYTGDIEHGTSVDHNALRIFRNRPEYRFKDRIHEQIAYALPAIPERFETSTVRIDHFGYLGVVREERDKSRRNIELLEQQIAEGNSSAFVEFNLGSEYLAIDEPLSARRHLQVAWERLENDPDRTRYPFFPSLSSRYVRALRHCGEYELVQEVGGEVLRLLPKFTDVVLEQADALQSAGQAEAAEARYRDALAMGDAPTEYAGSRGAGSFMARQALATLLLSQERHEEAAHELRECLRERPNYLAALQPLAHCLILEGGDGSAVRAELESLIGELSASALFLLAVPFYERGDIEFSESVLRDSLEIRPGADRARLALVEALLSKSAFQEAIAEAEKIDADTPVGTMASRSALFAALASAEPEQADIDRARKYAVAASMPEPELALFDMWATGVQSRSTLNPATAPLIVVMLEALARVEAFESFERLAAALDAVDVPERERREMLAGVYLARGFVELAANEWIGVVEKFGPDRRAMSGLAMVAELQGLDDDAAIFRQEAEALPA